MSDSPSGPAGNVAQPSIESARDTAFRRLAQETIGGGLTLDEYAGRAVAIQQAATDDELQAVLQAAPPGGAGAPAARRPRWLISVLARVGRRGQWRLRDRLRVVSVFTVQTLDLGTAQLEAPGSVVTIIAAFGGASVIVPQGVSLDISGFALFGGRNDNRADLPPWPASPLIRIRAFSIFGGVRVEDRAPQRNLLDAIRAGRKPASS
ncbi:MAG: hypothetical protein ACLQMH_04385 [Solirubrobacteraceae bacterium]